MFGRSRIAASRPRWLAIVEGPMNSSLFEEILQQNVSASVGGLKLKEGQRQRSKARDKWTTECFKQPKSHIVVWMTKSEAWPRFHWNAALWSQAGRSSETSQIYTSVKTVYCLEKWPEMPGRCGAVLDRVLNKGNNFRLGELFWMLGK